MVKPRRHYTLLEVSGRLGVSPQTVQRWLDAGRLQGWKTLGGHRRIDADSADALINEHIRAAGPATPPRILIVEDRAIDAAVLREHVLAVFPEARLMQACDGFEGLMMIGEEPPDLVLADLAMPHMNGAEMIRRLRGRLDPAPAFIVVTALQDREVQALGGLPDDVPLLRKPIDPGPCRQLLRRSLPRHAVAPASVSAPVAAPGA